MKTPIEEAVKKLVDSYHDGCGCEFCRSVEKEIKSVVKILSRHADKVEEPLAVLADRKGRSIYGIYELGGLWRINISLGERAGSKSFKEETYAECEAKARAYLMGLPDLKKGGE